MKASLRVSRPVDAVVAALRQRILAGEYRADEFLPPERALAEELGVSRLTLRAALARLEAEGLVRARQGEGVRVLDQAEHATLGVLAHLDLEARPEALRSFLELRRAVAAEAIAQACVRATKAQRATLERLAAEQAAETDEARYIARDIAFAREVLKAAKSFAGLLLFNSLAPIYEAQPALARALVADREQSLAGYQMTLALLREGDAAAARALVPAALEAADEAALARLSASKRKRGRA
jgi:GntR family transcriptional repressor for pyruvate dehydrogenase complex